MNNGGVAPITGAKPSQAPYLILVLSSSLLALVALLAERLLALGAEQQRVLQIFDWIICAVFFADFLYLLATTEKRWRYLVTWGWLDLLSAVPAVAAFRLARSARIVRVIRVLRVLRAARILARSLRQRRGTASLVSVGMMGFALLIASSVAILQVEQGPDVNIRSAEDAVWWSLSTMTTVGYGDRVPVTTEGRFVAGLLMIAGLGLFGTLSGFLASWFVAPSDDERTQELQDLRREVGALRAFLENQESHRPRPDPKAQA